MSSDKDRESGLLGCFPRTKDRENACIRGMCKMTYSRDSLKYPCICQRSANNALYGRCLTYIESPELPSDMSDFRQRLFGYSGKRLIQVLLRRPELACIEKVVPV
jgi:hypothetical protein